MKLYFTIGCFFLTLFSLYAQVESGSSIILTDTAEYNKRVIGIERVNNSTDGLNVSTFVSGKLNYALASGTNTLSVTLPFNPSVNEGFLVYFKAGSVNTGPITLSVNGSPFFPVLKQNGSTIDSAEILSNQIISAVFNGSIFQVISQLNRPCKNGFVAVNSEYCIDALPRPVSNFYNAVLSCGADDAMLCTWNQWYLACNDSIQNGSSGYLSNFEWVNDAGNNSSDAKVAGFNDNVAYVGYGCKKSYSLPPTFTSLNSAITSGVTIDVLFRCCYRK